METGDEHPVDTMAEAELRSARLAKLAVASAVLGLVAILLEGSVTAWIVPTEEDVLPWRIPPLLEDWIPVILVCFATLGSILGFAAVLCGLRGIAVANKHNRILAAVGLLLGGFAILLLVGCGAYSDGDLEGAAMPLLMGGVFYAWLVFMTYCGGMVADFPPGGAAGGNDAVDVNGEEEDRGLQSEIELREVRAASLAQWSRLSALLAVGALVLVSYNVAFLLTEKMGVEPLKRLFRLIQNTASQSTMATIFVVTSLAAGMVAYAAIVAGLRGNRRANTINRSLAVTGVGLGGLVFFGVCLMWIWLGVDARRPIVVVAGVAVQIIGLSGLSVLVDRPE